MPTDIHRICIRAKPAPNHPQYFEWQVASICMFVPEADKRAALQKARELLACERWEFVEYEDKSTLIEDRVMEQGGAVWDVYQYAKSGKIFFRVFPHHFGAGDKELSRFRPARITEAFMDDMIARAGGRRVDGEGIRQGIKNADYVLGDFIFELKDLQEEAMKKVGHQARLAELFKKYFPSQTAITLDPKVLSKTDYLVYLDILGGPMQTCVTCASKQIRSTKHLLGRADLHGGLIILNTGLGSFPHDDFGQQAKRYVRKDTTQIDETVSIDIWSHTNGFDLQAFFDFRPSQSKCPEVLAIKESFNWCFERMMTDLVLGKIPDTTPRDDPSRPLAFEVDGIDFAWSPPSIPLPWEIG